MLALERFLSCTSMDFKDWAVLQGDSSCWFPWTCMGAAASDLILLVWFCCTEHVKALVKFVPQPIRNIHVILVQRDCTETFQCVNKPWNSIIMKIWQEWTNYWGLRCRWPFFCGFLWECWGCALWSWVFSGQWDEIAIEIPRVKVVNASQLQK